MKRAVAGRVKIRFLTGLKGRMLVSIGATICIGLGLIVAVVLFEVSRRARESAIELAQKQSEAVGRDAGRAMNEAMTVARSVASSLKGLKLAGGTPSRTVADAILRGAVEAHPELMGAWTVWEPNAFDGRDAEFVNKAGHDATGRFIPYWTRASGTMTVEPNKDYTVEGAGDYYLKAKKLGRETITEPYAYQAGGRELLIASLVVPIHDESGSVIGVVGTDLELSAASARVTGAKIGTSGYVAVVSNAGLYVAHPKSERLGKSMAETDPWVKDFAQHIRDGKAFVTETFSTTLSSHVFRVASPIQIGRSSTNWSAIVSLPEYEVLASARRLAGIIAGVGIGVFVMVIAVVIVLAGRITRPIAEMAATLHEGSEQTASASGQVSSASQSLAQGAAEQASSLEETGASCEEMASMTKHNAEHATAAKALAAESRAAADGGARDMREMAAAMTELKAASASVAKIVKTIDEIAFQTNILALNAAVEAARAGEAGLGFAVVAEEVRNLAQRSAVAARETAATIETTIQRSDRGFELSEKVQSVLEMMVTKVHQVDELVGQIATASAEQSRGIEQINLALGQMDRVTQSTAAQAEETAGASEELSAQAETLKETVARLRTLVHGAGQLSGADADGSESLRMEVRTAPPVRRTARPSGEVVAGRS